jgi:O-antigen/teichoic acid export membrane protein
LQLNQKIVQSLALRIAGSISAVVISVLFIKIYSKENYGRYTEYYSVLVMMIQILQLGLAPMILRESVGNGKNSVIFTNSIYLITLLFSLIYAILSVTFDLFSFWHIITSYFCVINILISARLRGKGLLIASQLPETILRTFVVLLILVFCVYTESAVYQNFYVYALLMGAVGGTLMQLYFILRLDLRSLISEPLNINLVASKIVQEGVFIQLSGFVNQGMKVVPLIIAASIVDYFFIAELKIALLYSSVIYLILQSITIVFTPTFSRSNSLSELFGHIREIQRILFLPVIIIGGILFALSSVILNFLYASDYNTNLQTITNILLIFSILDVLLGPINQALILFRRAILVSVTSIIIFTITMVLFSLCLMSGWNTFSVIIIGVAPIIIKTALYIITKGDL